MKIINNSRSQTRGKHRFFSFCSHKTTADTRDKQTVAHLFPPPITGTRAVINIRQFISELDHIYAQKPRFSLRARVHRPLSQLWSF